MPVRKQIGKPCNQFTTNHASSQDVALPGAINILKTSVEIITGKMSNHQWAQFLFGGIAGEKLNNYAYYAFALPGLPIAG